MEWKGENENEKGYISKIDYNNIQFLSNKLETLNNVSVGDCIVEVSPNYYRPTEVELLIGDYSKAKNILGWEPQTQLSELVKIMTEADYKSVVKKGY